MLARPVARAMLAAWFVSRGIDAVRHPSKHAAESLPPGQSIEGPAVIEGYTATTWVAPGWTAALDAANNLILRKT